MADLVAQVVDLEAIGGTGTTVGKPTREVVTERLTVTGEDISGLALRTALGGTARGRVRFEGAPSPAPPSSATSSYAADMGNSGLPMTSTATVNLVGRSS